MKNAVKFLFKQLKKPFKKLFKIKKVRTFFPIIFWLHMSFLVSLYTTEVSFMPYRNVLQSLSVKPELITGVLLATALVIVLYLRSRSYKKRGESAKKSNIDFICCYIIGFTSAVLLKSIFDYIFPGMEESLFYFITTITVFMCSIEYLILNQKEKPVC